MPWLGGMDLVKDVVIPLIVGLIGAVIYAAVGKIYESWTPLTMVRNGVVLLACLFVIGHIFALRIARSYSPPEIEAGVKPWIESLSWPNQRVLTDTGSNFHFVVHAWGVPVNVFNPKSHPNLIVVQTNVNLSRDFKDLPAREKEDFIFRLRDRLLLMGVGYEGVDGNLDNVEFQEFLTYGPSLTPTEFVKRLQLVSSALKMTTNTFALESRKAAR